MEREVTIMKYKHIEAAREARLWIGQIIVPTIAVVGSMLAIPEVRGVVAEKARQIKWKIESTKNKGF